VPHIFVRSIKRTKSIKTTNLINNYDHWLTRLHSAERPIYWISTHSMTYVHRVLCMMHVHLMHDVAHAVWQVYSSITLQFKSVWSIRHMFTRCNVTNHIHRITNYMHQLQQTVKSESKMPHSLTMPLQQLTAEKTATVNKTLL